MKSIFVVGNLAISSEHIDDPAPVGPLGFDGAEVGEGVREAGARVEVRRWVGDAMGSFCLLRADCFRGIPGTPDRFEHAHYHEGFDGDRPKGREWDPALQVDPVNWVKARIAALPDDLDRLGAADLVGLVDRRELSEALPFVEEAMRRDLERKTDSP